MDGQLPASRPARVLMAVAWPSFLTACLLEGLVFGLIDPQDLHSDWPREAIYSLGFAIFWLGTASASALTAQLLSRRSRPGAATPRA